MNDAELLRTQKQELDALSNIYLSDLELLRSTFPIKLSISCCPYSEVHGEGMIAGYEEYKTKIHIEFTKEYPRNPPRIEIEPVLGITQDNIVAMERKVDQMIGYTRGRPLVYDIVELVREWIQSFLVEGKDVIEEESSLKLVDEVFERPKFATYTPVTLDNFMKWKYAFEAEMNELKKKKKAEEEEKLSGKQWFMKHKQLALQQDSEEQSSEEGDGNDEA